MRFSLLLFLSLRLLTDLSGAASVFIFNDQSGPGEGFSDATRRRPLDGNSGSTVGEQRRLAFEQAGAIWGQYLVSSVPIEVAVTYAPLGTSALAAAGPNTLERDFPNAREANTYYPVALANSLAGSDLDPGQVDINVTVSSDANFYLGFSQNVPAGSFSLLDVILHELGHGLGFVSLVNNSTGELYDNRSDVFTQRIFDLQQNRPWIEMNPERRFASRTNDPFVVWTGESTTLGYPFVLNTAPGPVQAAVTEPSALAGSVPVLLADFGASVPASGLESSLVMARDGSEVSGTAATACTDLTNTEEIAGKIVLIRRGDCFFDEKTLRAQQAGAIAVLIANNAGEDLVLMGASDEVSDAITIPALFISQSDGDALELASPGVNIRLEQPIGRAGSNGPNLRLHAPGAFSGGSSISHWTTAASPNLLMEPIINPDLDRRLDLTLTLMRDIGWKVIDIPFPHLSYELWAAENLNQFITAREPLDDPSGRGVTNLEKYVFGLPESATQVQLPVLSFPDQIGQLDYTRSTMPADVEISYEISTDLQTFRPALAGVDYLEEQTTPLSHMTEKVTLTLLDSPVTQAFLRLRLTVP